MVKETRKTRQIFHTLSSSIYYATYSCIFLPTKCKCVMYTSVSCILLQSPEAHICGICYPPHTLLVIKLSETQVCRSETRPGFPVPAYRVFDVLEEPYRLLCIWSHRCIWGYLRQEIWTTACVRSFPHHFLMLAMGKQQSMLNIDVIQCVSQTYHW